MAQGRFIAYEPTSLKVIDGRVTDADAASIRADLMQLRERFDALITYDAIHGAQAIPAIAAELKFRALIIGVWDPREPAQLAAALDAARRFPQLVAGISLGNELIFSHRIAPPALLALIAQVSTQAPAVPLSTTQIAHELGQSPGSVNQHLSVLRGSGLVVSRRSGRSVLYRQTPLAQSMIAAQQVARHGTLGTLPPTRLRR